MLKTIIHPVTGQSFKMGRKRPVVQCPRLSIKNYLQKSLPAPPAGVDYTAKAKTVLQRVFLNDSLGCCVIAGMGHVEGVLSSNAGSPVILTDADIEMLYGDIGGYVPGDPSTDNGCDEQTALNWWQQKGLLPPEAGAQHKIQGWMKVNAGDREEVRVALWLFENLIFGVELPDEWIDPMPSERGFLWDAAGPPDPENGHCFIANGYGRNLLAINSWGMQGFITNAAIEKYAAASDSGELYTVISQDAIAKATQKAPTGFDFSQLLADFDSMKG